MEMMEHLLPNIREFAMLPAETRSIKLQSECWIGYTNAEKALTRFKTMHP